MNEVELRPSPFPAWKWAVTEPGGKVIKRFRSLGQAHKWLEKNGYTFEGA